MLIDCIGEGPRISTIDVFDHIANEFNHKGFSALKCFIVTPEELEAVTKSTHHEGVAMIVKTRKLPTVSEILNQPGRNLILALEEVENPHNLGAIMRTAAHFGVSGILYEAKVPVA